MSGGETVYLLATDADTSDAVETACRGWQFACKRLSDIRGLANDAALSSSATGCVVLVAPKANAVLKRIQATPLSAVPHPVIVVVWDVTVRQSVAILRAGAWHLLVWPADLLHLRNAIPDALAEDARRLVRRRKLAELRGRLSQLSSQEYEVMRLTLLGGTNKTITHALGIGGRTTDYRRASVFRKMGVENPAALVYLFASTDHDSLLTEITKKCVPPSHGATAQDAHHSRTSFSSRLPFARTSR